LCDATNLKISRIQYANRDPVAIGSVPHLPDWWAAAGINPRLECNRYGWSTVAAALAVERGEVVVDICPNARERCVLN
jgi:hypothetical protein